jgi:hypothetical protein
LKNVLKNIWNKKLLGNTFANKIENKKNRQRFLQKKSKKYDKTENMKFFRKLVVVFRKKQMYNYFKNVYRQR